MISACLRYSIVKAGMDRVRCALCSLPVMCIPKIVLRHCNALSAFHLRNTLNDLNTSSVKLLLNVRHCVSYLARNSEQIMPRLIERDEVMFKIALGSLIPWYRLKGCPILGSSSARGIRVCSVFVTCLYQYRSYSTISSLMYIR